MKVYIVTENYSNYSEANTEILGVYHDETLAIQMCFAYDMAYELDASKHWNDYHCMDWDVQEWEVQ